MSLTDLVLKGLKAERENACGGPVEGMEKTQLQTQGGQGVQCNARLLRLELRTVRTPLWNFEPLSLLCQ